MNEIPRSFMHICFNYLSFHKTIDNQKLKHENNKQNASTF